MKVKVKDIKPNPFRRIESYPINREKVEQFKISITENTFWQNLYDRKNSKGKVEIAYGHHRLVALKELGIKEINIPIRKLSDAKMLKIMADENLDHWRANTAVNNETVLATKEYLDGEFKKHTFKTLSSDLINLLDQKTEKAFNKVKAGVGQTTILKFLGENWKQWMVQNALAAITDENIDRDALEQFEHPGHAEAF
jgi:hypothetical protein